MSGESEKVLGARRWKVLVEVWESVGTVGKHYIAINLELQQLTAKQE